jgi:hypothetical protein
MTNPTKPDKKPDTSLNTHRKPTTNQALVVLSVGFLSPELDEDRPTVSAIGNTLVGPHRGLKPLQFGVSAVLGRYADRSGTGEELFEVIERDTVPTVPDSVDNAQFFERAKDTFDSSRREQCDLSQLRLRHPHDALAVGTSGHFEEEEPLRRVLESRDIDNLAVVADTHVTLLRYVHDTLSGFSVPQSRLWLGSKSPSFTKVKQRRESRVLGRALPSVKINEMSVSRRAA